MNNELLAVVEYMERERGIERETLLKAVEAALVNASQKSMEYAKDLRIEIDRKTLDIHAFAKKIVVEKVESKDNEVPLWKAREIDPEIQIGDQQEVEITPGKFGRITAQTTKQAILHRIRQVEKERIFGEFKDREGDVVSGSVRRFDRSDVMVDIGRAEAVLPARERVPSEEYQEGDRIRAYILSVKDLPQGPEVRLSRSHPNFVRRLFEMEVTEISDGTVEIKGIAREPGYRSKVAVVSEDEKVDPVGACVGMRGIRVKNIVRELGGEKIDIVRWSNDVKTFITNALAPARLTRMNVNEDTHSVNVVVDGDQLSLAIGKKGQNARLTAKLTGWKIDIQKDEEDMDFGERVALAIENLSKIDGIETEQAEALVQSGFLTLEGILAAEPEDLELVESFDLQTAIRIKQAAESHYDLTHGKVEV